MITLAAVDQLIHGLFETPNGTFLQGLRMK